jgi:hypothetical protein
MLYNCSQQSLILTSEFDDLFWCNVLGFFFLSIKQFHVLIMFVVESFHKSIKYDHVKGSFVHMLY